jgi:6-phosphogluconolactonase (cycloisomerase 2 family)
VAGPAYDTGGTGSGGGLGNQGALATDGEFLLAVNPGSDDVSVFKIGKHGLRLVDRTSSGGAQPVSVTVHRNLVYVLNAGSDSIAGFWMGHSGRLYALPGSEHGLSGAGTGPAQIQFGADGRTLIVTEKATNKIVTFALNHRGMPVDRTITDSVVATPFGFAVTRNNIAVISEALGGAPNSSAVSSYRIRRGGAVSVIDGGVGTTQTAACWVALTPNDRFAFVTNTGSGNVSSYFVRGNGDLVLLEAIAGDTGAGSSPIDADVSDDGDHLYVLNTGTDTIAVFRITPFGGLKQVGEAAGIPTAATGLLAF